MAVMWGMEMLLLLFFYRDLHTLKEAEDQQAKNKSQEYQTECVHNNHIVDNNRENQYDRLEICFLTLSPYILL